MYSSFAEYQSFPSKEGYQENWMLLQYDNRVLSDMDQEGCRRNKQYCEQFGYTYRFMDHSSFDLPPYWQKVKLVQYLLETESCKGILWMDTDAAVMRSMSLDDLCPDDKHMVFAPDPPIWGNVSNMNAGVWAIKNTMEGKQIMKRWMDRYDPTQWTKTNDGWSSLGIWAGSTYEQGSFSELVPTLYHLVHIVDWRVLQDVKMTDQTFTMHFSNHQKSLRPEVFRLFDLVP